MKALLLKAVEALKQVQGCAGGIVRPRVAEVIADLEAAIREQPGEAVAGRERLVNAYGSAERSHACAVYASAPADVIAARQREVFDTHAALVAAVAPLKDEGEASPMRDGCTFSALSSSDKWHRLIIHYATREQADAAQEWLAGDSPVTNSDATSGKAQP